MGVYNEMATQRDRLERATKTLEKELRAMKKKQARKSKIVRMKNGSEEIILVEREGFQVRCPLYEGSVIPEYIRVVDTKKRGKELAYWDHSEFMESTDPFDSSTALAAVFSVIELVFSGQYPPREERNA